VLDFGCSLSPRNHIDPASPDRFAPEERLEHLQDAKWWFCRLRQKSVQVVEQTARDIGAIS
jgi:hypothetical protein